ncbi:hypothetical protein NDU88_006493 [Pleurodeles waltl]|uniref:Uncharacterized protein n=1 Tax=Pleurodeles waltl TaxID=8319 RepID=A0AAV7QNR3_PLEWA|nr:hypothetical protein NDU88_006493 [Pleurodeles waltl]
MIPRRALGGSRTCPPQHQSGNKEGRAGSRSQPWQSKLIQGSRQRRVRLRLVPLGMVSRVVRGRRAQEEGGGGERGR